MPVKSKIAAKAPIAKTDGVKSDGGKSGSAKHQSARQASVKPTAAKAKPAIASVKPTNISKSPSKSAPVAKTKSPAAVPETVSQAAKRPAAVSTQKHETSKKTNQPRMPMSPPSVSKAATVAKAPAKGAAVKPVAIKAAPAKAHHAKKEPAKAAAKPVAPVAKTAEAKAAKPVATPAVAAPLAAAQVHAQRQAGQKAATARAMPAAVATSAAQRISAPAAPAAVAAVVTPKDLALKAQQAQLAAGPKKPVSARHGFKTNEWIVYPAHGVGRIVAIEEQEIAGMALELFVITFEKDKMTLRVPTGKSQSVGMRKLAEEGVVKRAMDTLKGKARIKRTMWSRRAQEFEQKINSGDLVSIAEVVRDLFRAETQPEQSYSERQLYEAALDRMAREIAAVEKIDERGAVQRVTEVLSRSAKSRRAESDAAVASGDVKAA